jgi:hypothetical protein
VPRQWIADPRFPELYVTGAGRASRSVSGWLRSVAGKDLRTLARPRTSDSRRAAVTQISRQPPVPIASNSCGCAAGACGRHFIEWPVHDRRTMAGEARVAAGATPRRLGLRSPLETPREEKAANLMWSAALIPILRLAPAAGLAGGRLFRRADLGGRLVGSVGKPRRTGKIDANLLDWRIGVLSY